jgi:branched-chain amino acid transport system substrate-binding protein
VGSRKKKSSLRSGFFTPGLVFLLITACSSPTQKEAKTSTGGGPSTVQSGGLAEHVSQQESREYKEIELLFSKSMNDTFLAKIATFQKRHPRSPLLLSIENLQGLLLLRGKRATDAVTHFKRAVSSNAANESYNQYILYNLATAQLEASQLDDAQQTANRINLELLDKTNRIKVYYLKANIFDKKSLPLEAARQLLSAGRLLEELGSPENRRIFYKLIDRSLQSVNDIPSLEKLYQEYEDSPVADAPLFHLGSHEMLVGNTGNGEIHLKLLLTRFPQSVYYSQIADINNHPQTKIEVDSRSVGVLLPMKGKFAKFGSKSLQGIEMAFGIFTPGTTDAKVNLIVEDSGDDADQAVKALNRLVFKHHVVAVIGPMLTKGIDAVSQRAHELGVPLITLARRAGAPLEYVFPAGLTQQVQAYEIARYAIQRLGAKRFAMIYPNEKLGLEISQSFWDAVESMGGKIVGAEYYNPGETDFRHSIDKLSGLYYTDARQRELDLLSQEREANNIKKKTRKTEKFYQLKPIVDYDAVFIPDEPKVAGQIIPTFAYRDVEHVKFLGVSSWNSPDFLSRVQSYADQATFVDAFFPESESPRVRTFLEKYKKSFNQDATALEAIAYDAGLLVQNVLNSSTSPLSRDDFRDRLKTIHDLQGVTGKLTYKNGQFYRDLTVIKVKDNKFVEVP